MKKAYDLEKVLEQLHRLSDEEEDKISVCEKGYELYHDGFSDGVDEAIEIVKGGIVYEKHNHGVNYPIKEEPTAFDVYEIVDRIEEFKKKKYGACTEEDCDNCKYERECWDGEKGGFLALDKVLEIIKGGVSDEKNNCGVVYPDNAR